MPNRSQWVLLIAGAIALWLVLGAIARRAAAPTPGNQAFRQRLVAVGDLHGGASPLKQR